MKIIGYIGIFNDVVESKAYHGYGWTRATVGQLEMIGYHVDILNSESDLSLYKELFLDEGQNFEDKKWNKIGGDFTKVNKKIELLNNWSGTIFYNGLRGVATYSDLIEKRKLPSVTTWGSIVLEPIWFSSMSTKLVIGDSHATSVWEPNYALLSINGKTQHSYVASGLENFIEPHTKTLRVYFGNIDIRFHLKRLNIDLHQYVKNLFVQLIELNKRGISIEVVQPLPVEDESRKLPLTGQFKKKNFYGSQEERQSIRNDIDFLYGKLCQKWGFTYITWPDSFIIEGKLTTEVMEPKSSVHLSPKHYTYKINPQLC